MWWNLTQALDRGQHLVVHNSFILRYTYFSFLHSLTTRFPTRNDTTAAEKALARAEARRRIVQAFHFLASVLEGIGNGTYRQGLLWYEMTASKSVDTLYQIARLRGQLPTYVNRSSVKLQPFPLRHSFIPAACVRFDRTVVACQILRQDQKRAYQNREFWNEHVHLNRRPFLPGLGGREFDAFWTGGIGVSILKRTPSIEKGAGGKRKGDQAKRSKSRPFSILHTL